MRIGIDARFYTPQFTGIGRYVYELVHGLLKIDKKNEYVVFLNAPYFEEFSPPNARVKKVLADAPHYSLKEQLNFWRTLENEKLDLMHFTHFNAPLLYRRPSIVTIHDLTLTMFPGKKMRSLPRRLAYHLTVSSIVRRARRVIAVSENTKQDLEKFLHTSAAKISVIYEGVNEAFSPITEVKILDALRHRYDLTKPYILYTGVWRSHKNLVNLIRAFKILKTRHSFDGHLVLTGKADPWYPEVRETIQSEGLAHDVKLLGLIPEKDLPALYSAATCFAFPSLYEGFGLPILEAFACGTPVCAARSSSLPEVAGEGNALFFDPYDVEDIASQLALLTADTEKSKTLREKLRTHGLKRVKDFSWETMCKQTLAEYERAAE